MGRRKLNSQLFYFGKAIFSAVCSNFDPYLSPFSLSESHNVLCVVRCCPWPRQSSTCRAVSPRHLHFPLLGQSAAGSHPGLHINCFTHLAWFALSLAAQLSPCACVDLESREHEGHSVRGVSVGERQLGRRYDGDL